MTLKEQLLRNSLKRNDQRFSTSKNSIERLRLIVAAVTGTSIDRTVSDSAGPETQCGSKLNVDRGLKILHKGKVLLHPPPPHNTTTSTPPPLPLTDRLNQLLEISRKGWTSSQKASLFAMGTRNESQVLGRPTENILWQWKWKWNQLLSLPRYVLQTSLDAPTGNHSRLD